MINEYNYLRQSVSHICNELRQLLAADENVKGPEQMTDIESQSRQRNNAQEILGLVQLGPMLETAPVCVAQRKCPKNRAWEKRQKGYKAEYLRIDNVARVQKARVRRDLRSSVLWENLSLEARSQREADALSYIDGKRREKKAFAKASFVKGDHNTLTCSSR
jgi:hypothetical protein